MEIFPETDNRSDLEKLGINAFKVFKSGGRWVFEKGGKTYDFAPAQITDASLSPVVVGADRLINLGCKSKNMADYENGFVLLVSNNYFPSCDVRLGYKEPLYDGWLYDVYSENLQGVMAGQQTWICPYIKFYYTEPPNILYLKMISISEHSTPI
jgi:hypothetical protein